MRRPGNTAASVARELELTETAVRKWAARADIDDGYRIARHVRDREIGGAAFLAEQIDEIARQRHDIGNLLVADGYLREGLIDIEELRLIDGNDDLPRASSGGNRQDIRRRGNRERGRRRLSLRRECTRHEHKHCGESKYARPAFDRGHGRTGFSTVVPSP